MVENVKQKASNHASFGVEALIEKVRDKGVRAGQVEADRIIAEARLKAVAIKKQAQQEADKMIADASKQTEALKAAGKDALKLAARDAHLKLRELLMTRFSDEVRRLVGHIMEPQPFMEKLILQVAGRARDEAGLDKQDTLSIKLPDSLIRIDDLRKNPEELKEGTMAHFVLSVMAGLFRAGITYCPAGDVKTGLKIYLKDGDVEVDLTDEAVSAVLLEHLQPRFRALLEGVVK